MTPPPASGSPDVSILLVSYNTKHLLDRCLESIRASAGTLRYEVVVVDNQSRDGSAEYLKTHHPEVILVESPVNLGFGAANNRALESASGRHIVLLNTDAFFVGSSLETAVRKMDQETDIGIAGARLVGEDGVFQPSARSYPTVWRDFTLLSGLAAKFPKSRLFARVDLSYLDHSRPIDCEWVPGAFSIIRRAVIDQVGFFDPAFFLYYEEVDLCKRTRAAGWRITYWPDVEVIHIGGASASAHSEKILTKSGKQLLLWQLQSHFLFFRKHYGGLTALFSRWSTGTFNRLRWWANRKKDPQKAAESESVLLTLQEAWSRTSGGKVSPNRPW